MSRLADKVAIITGAGSGMGREEAALFAREGAKVVATDINEAAVQAVVKEIEAEGALQRQSRTMWHPRSNGSALLKRRLRHMAESTFSSTTQVFRSRLVCSIQQWSSGTK